MAEARAEIDRLLRNFYEASSSPMPDRLADRLKKLEEIQPFRSGDAPPKGAEKDEAYDESPI